MSGFPLSGFHRTVVENQLAFAEELLNASERDVRAILAGKPRSTTFKPDTDPVTILIEHAKQVAMCEAILKVDDEARQD